MAIKFDPILATLGKYGLRTDDSGGGGGSGTVTSVSVTSANGLAGTVATATTTPAITLSTTVTGIMKGDGTGISAATPGTDYSAGTSALATGIVKSTTTTGALTIAVAGDFPTLNQNTSGTAANATNVGITDDTTTNATMYPTWVTANTGNIPAKVSSTKMTFNPSLGRLGSVALTLNSTGSSSIADASLDVFGTTNAIIHGHNTGAQSSSAGAATIMYALPGAAMTSGNRLGAYISGGSSDVSNTLYNATAISSFATETWSGTAGGAKLQFEVTPNTTVTRSVAMTIDQNGRIGLDGVTSPSNIIHISSGGATGKIQFGDSFTLGGTNGAARIIAITASKNFEIYASTGGTATSTLGMDTPLLTLGNASLAGGISIPYLNTGTGISVSVPNSASAGVIGRSVVVGNTQTQAVILDQLDTGTAAVAHTGLSVKVYNASSTAKGINIDPSTTCTGIGINFANVGGDAYRSIELNNIGSTGAATTTYGIHITSVGNTTGQNASYGMYIQAVNSGNNPASCHGIYMGSINSGGATSYGIRQNIIGDGFAASYGWYVDNLVKATSTSEAAIKYFSLNNVQSANLAARTNDASEILFSRTNTRTSTTVADNFNLSYWKDTAVQNGAGGTFTVAGSVLKLETVATQTAGTLTHTKDNLNLTQSATITTGKLITGVVGATERFKAHPVVQNSGTNTAYLFDTTTSLTGTTKLASFANAGTEKFAIDNAGAFSCGNTVAAAVAIASTHKVTVVIGGTTYYLLASNV